VHVSGATSGNGSFTQSDFDNIFFHWPTAVNYFAQWVGQPQTGGTWGNQCTTDFNIFSMTTGPSGADCNLLTPHGAPGSEAMTLTSFAPVPAPGACCLQTGSCALYSAPECLINDGNPMAVGTTCTAIMCPPPGSCCDAAIACTVKLAADCPSTSVWTSGGVCSPNPCVAIGPCCNVVNGGCAVTTHSACGTAAHTWYSSGACSPNNCDQPGSCCDTSLGCRRLTQARCTGATVTWLASTACSPLPCTLNGRCCNFISGSCATTLQGDCGTSSHTWAFGGTCSPNTCAQPGACCAAPAGGDGICRRLAQTECVSPNIWSAGTCTPNPCFVTFAAKWTGSTTNAKAIAIFDLAQPPILLNPGTNSTGYGTTFKNLRLRVYGAAAGNGTFTQASFTGISFHWPVAVNFLTQWVGQPQDSGTHWGVGDPSHAMTFSHDFNFNPGVPGAPGGTWYYELTAGVPNGDRMELSSFAPVPAPGACCADDGTCTAVADAECIYAGNTPLAANSACSPNNPCTLLGRCCNFVTGSCALTALADCATASHTWGYSGSCSPNPCPAVGSCCNAGACRRLTQSLCTTGSGTWTSGGVCTPNPCIVLFAATSGCRADFNHSGSVDAADIFDFLNAWLTGDRSADFSGDGTTNIQDVVDFVSAWFAGC
jgi:hypothetical protein